MNINDAFPSKYLKASDLQGRNLTVRMDQVQVEEVGGGDKKAVLYFQNAQKGLVLNRINASTIEMSYGSDTDRWRGQPLTLRPDNTLYKGQPVPCIRLSVPPKQQPEPTPETAPDPAVEGHGGGDLPADFDDGLPF